MKKLRPWDALITATPTWQGGFTHTLAKLAIKYFQWAPWHLGHGRNSWPTHARHFVGKLNPRMIGAAYRAGQLEQCAVDAGMTIYAYVGALTAFDDWSFSQTDPFAKWERLAWFEDKERIAVCRPIFCHPDQIRHSFLESQCWRFIGRSYDRWQLLGIWFNSLLGLEPDEYRRYLDKGKSFTVCSGAVAAHWEALRREIQKEWADAGGRMDDLHRSECPFPWPRLFGGLHVERVAPSHFLTEPNEWEVMSDNGKR